MPTVAVRVAAVCVGMLAVIGCTYDYEGATRCNNGVLDGDETDVDCGGDCVVEGNGKRTGGCAFWKQCRTTADCQGAVDGTDGVTCAIVPSPMTPAPLGRCTRLSWHWVQLTGRTPELWDYLALG